ncbi:phycobiliprotein lyase [Gloeobacter morelensis]|uniref:phycobiliprotein lyase n=1 Tax=Gloeobacter morelensis TaxID=2907343 RepID=UPI001E38EDE7|nr:phycobiliprotein lyase [Gloeobacter morelensis]
MAIVKHVAEFFEQSFGRWRSQRSGHHLAFSHFEEVRSTIDIEPLTVADPAVVALCQRYAVCAEAITHPFRMRWQGESDWEENATFEGSTVLVPVPDPGDATRGKLLRDQGYAETVAAVGEYALGPDGTFVLFTDYERASAEERIWFATPNVRFRVSLIRTRDGAGVTTASFSSEIRALAK